LSRNDDFVGTRPGRKENRCFSGRSNPERKKGIPQKAQSDGGTQMGPEEVLKIIEQTAQHRKMDLVGALEEVEDDNESSRNSSIHYSRPFQFKSKIG
jgi:hypothetical protein